MEFNINELRDTLEINRQEMTNNKSLTNEYIVDDIMTELGYNKKKNKNVKRLSDELIDWQVIMNDKPTIAVKVFALGESNVNEAELNECVEYCKQNDYDIVILTNGETLNISRLNKDKSDYIDVISISLMEDLDEVKTNVLEAISNNTFDLSKIDELIAKTDISIDKIKEIIENNIDMLVGNIAALLGDTSDSTKEQIKVCISELFSESKEVAENIEVPNNTEEINSLRNKIEELTNQINNNTADKQLEEIKNTLLNKEEIIKSKDSEIEQLKGQLSANEPADDQSEIISSKDAEIEQLKSQLSAIESNSNQSEETNKKIEELESQLSAKDTEIGNLNNAIKELKNSIETGAEPVATSSEASRDEIDSYRNKIEELSLKCAELQTTIDNLNEKLKVSEEQLNEMSGADKRKAIELLDVIVDNPELARSYVGVINTELIQYESISTFVGRSLQMLYEIKSYQASQFIFNGDIFKLVQPAVRNDLVMNNKAYDINVDGMLEDDVLNKLRIIFSHFDDVIFQCKKIGSIGKESKTLNEEKETVRNNIETQDSEADNDAEFTESNEELFNNSETDSEEQLENTGEQEDDDIFESEDTDGTCILCAQLLQINDLLYESDPVDIINIRCIGSNEVNLNVNMDMDEISIEQLICKSIDAILAITMSNGRYDIVTSVRQMDLSTVNNFIQPYSAEYVEFPRINGTRYVIAGLQTVKEGIAVIEDICKALGIDTSIIFVYMDAVTESEQLVSDWGFADEVQFRENTEYSEQASEEQNEIAILKGNIFTSIMITKNSLQAQKDIFKESLAIKTNYMGYRMHVDGEFAEAIRQIVAKAVETYGDNVNLNSLGNVIGESYKLASVNQDEVSEDSTQVEVDGLTFYVSNVEEWQIPLSIIKAHRELMQSASIAVKLYIDKNALDFYMNHYVVSEPSLSLAVQSLSRYVNDCLKK